tara:strand:+ start:19 stop:201 length:183 start_codon:yes stop_codon:yes gene_type:complete
METKETVKTIEATPTPDGYIVMLRTIIEGSTNKDDVAWAKLELAKTRISIPKGPRLGGSK